MSPDGGQSIYHDCNHALPIGPHIDWNVGKERWRIFPDGRLERKNKGKKNIRKHILPTNETAEWMQNSLREGPSLKMSRMVDVAWRWNDAAFFSFGYECLENFQLLNFDAGDVVGNADSLILEYARDKYKKQKMHFLVEDWAIKKNTPYLVELAKLGVSHIFCKNEVYYFLEIDGLLTEELFAGAFRNLPAALHAYIIPNCGDFYVGMEIHEDDLRKIAENTREIICGAYDGEGYVVASIEGD